MAINEIADLDFDAEVLQSDILVVACFTASRCSSCFPTCMTTDSLAEEYDQRIKFVRCDAERCAEVVEKYNIGVFPTILIFDNAESVTKIVGFREKPTLKRLLESHLQE